MAAGAQDVEVRFTVSPEGLWVVGNLAMQGHRLFFGSPAEVVRHHRDNYTR